MIKNFAHKGLEHFYHTGNKTGIQAQHAKKGILIRLDMAAEPDDLNLPSFHLYELKGKRKGI